MTDKPITHRLKFRFKPSDKEETVIDCTSQNEALMWRLDLMEEFHVPKIAIRIVKVKSD